MKLQAEFNAYLANLAVMTFKLHNLHWNVTGLQFVQVHKYTEELYDQMFEYFDQIAEIQKIYGHMPDVKLGDYASKATIEEIDARSFTAEEVLSIIKSDIYLLRKQATELRNACDEENWFSSVSLLEDHVGSYNKTLWFLAAMTS